jgi:hypothetical protein
MTLEWPSTLPQRVERDGFQRTMLNTRIESSMDSGEKKRRRRFSWGEEPLVGTMIMTPDQYDQLYDFYKNTVKQVLPFSFPDPDDPDGENTITVIFSAAPSEVTFGATSRRVTLAFDIQP